MLWEAEFRFRALRSRARTHDLQQRHQDERL